MNDFLEGGCQGCTWQSFENVLDYIKDNLGASTHQIEFSDDEIIDKICEHVLPRFSKYDPLKRYYRCTEENNLITSNPTFIYEIKNFDYKIIKIAALYNTATLQDMDQLYQLSAKQNMNDVTNYLTNVNYIHMQNTVLPPELWFFRPPNRIEVIHSTAGSVMRINRSFIAEIDCVHKTPETITPDLYSYFLNAALGYIQVAIGRARLKFENFTTPYGEVQIQARSLVDEGRELLRDTYENLRQLTPDDYIFMLN